MPGHAGACDHPSGAFQAIMQPDMTAVHASCRPQHCGVATQALLCVQLGQSFREPVPTMWLHASTMWLWSRVACVEHCDTLLQVGLVRQMERSQKEFQDWRREREREVMQLRRQVSTSQLWLQHCFHQHISASALQLLKLRRSTVDISLSVCAKRCLQQVQHNAHASQGQYLLAV